MDIEALNNQIIELQKLNKLLQKQKEELIQNFTFEINTLKKHYIKPKKDIQPPNAVIDCLQNGYIANNLAYNEDLNEYSDFHNIRDMSSFHFQNTYSNRIIKQTVIDKKVEINKEYYQRNNKFLNCGTLKLAVIHNNDPENNNTFWVVDGQHRIEIIKQLVKEFPNELFPINVTVTIVKSELEFQEFLRLYQQQYPPNMHMFSATLVERVIKEGLLSEFRRIYPKVLEKYDNHITKIATSFNCGSVDKDIISMYDRKVEEVPHLTEPIIFELYTKINVFNKLDENGNPYILNNLHLVKEINDEMIRVFFNGLDTLTKIQRVDNCCYSYIYHRRESKKTFRYINNKFT